MSNAAVSESPECAAPSQQITAEGANHAANAVEWMLPGGEDEPREVRGIDPSGEHVRIEGNAMDMWAVPEHSDSAGRGDQGCYASRGAESDDSFPWTAIRSAERRAMGESMELAPRTANPQGLQPSQRTAGGKGADS